MAVKLVLMAAIRNCANTTRRKASLNKRLRPSIARENGLNSSIMTASRKAKMPPIIIPINIWMVTRPASLPTTCNSSAWMRNQTAAFSLKELASAGNRSNSQLGNIFLESSTICAILANKTVTLPESDLKKVNKLAPATTSKLTTTNTKIPTAHILDSPVECLLRK